MLLTKKCNFVTVISYGKRGGLLGGGENLRKSELDPVNCFRNLFVFSFKEQLIKYVLFCTPKAVKP